LLTPYRSIERLATWYRTLPVVAIRYCACSIGAADAVSVPDAVIDTTPGRMAPAATVIVPDPVIATVAVLIAVDATVSVPDAVIEQTPDMIVLTMLALDVRVPLPVIGRS